jgi:hypothetical protein
MRSVTNAYGLGATASLGADLGWNWTRPGSWWGFAADGDYQTLSKRQGATSALTAWRGSISAHRVLTRRMQWSATYSLLRTEGLYSGLNYGLTRSAVQVSLMFSFADLMGPIR